MLMLLAALALFQETAPSDEIVVTAKRQSCTAFFRGEALSDRRLERYARDWKAGLPVRVRAPSNADYRCLARVAFKLGKLGINRIEFVGPSD